MPFRWSRLWCCLLLVGHWSAGPVVADEAEDEAAIRKLFATYTEAIKARSATRIAACYLPRNANGSATTSGNPRLDDALMVRARNEWAKALQGTATIETSGGVVKIGVDDDQALVRWVFRFYVQAEGGRTKTLETGVRDCLVERQNGRWLITDKSWASRDIFFDIEEVLRSYRAATTGQNPFVLQLVISQQGGVWTPVRAMTWEGAVLTPAEVGRGLDDNGFRGDLYEHFNDFYERGLPGSAHLFFQRGYVGWGFVGAVWHANAQAERELELHSLNEEFVRRAREQVEGEAFGSAAAHLAMGRLLAQQISFIEAADEFEKAEALAPRTVPANELADTRRRRGEDPRVKTQDVINLETKLGLPPDHPSQIVQSWLRESTSAHKYTAMGLAASQWGADRDAQGYQRMADQLRRSGVIGDRIDLDALGIMYDHLVRRLQLVTIKPNHALRSQRFFVRYQRGDRNILPMLAALEQAQQVIYSVFQQAMAGTEVLLFPNQNEFSRYRELAQGAATSEYLQAETVTNVLTTRRELFVLSQEIITFPSAANDLIKTVQHEYGHVAVNRMARGRFVPDWINEGIACVTEGGYPHALKRCKQAAASDSLIRMNELLARSNRQQPGQWTFQGERALLAYSQANLMVDFLIRTRGSSRLLALLDRIGFNTPPSAAFLAIYGVSEQTLFDEWLLDLAATR